MTPSTPVCSTTCGVHHDPHGKESYSVGREPVRAERTRIWSAKVGISAFPERLNCLKETVVVRRFFVFSQLIRAVRAEIYRQPTPCAAFTAYE